MKKQIITLVSLILLFLNFAYANECTPENSAGSWVYYNKLQIADGPGCGKATLEMRFHLTLFNVDGNITGHGYSRSRQTYEKAACKGSIENHDFPKMGLKDGKITFEQADGNGWVEECSISDDGESMTLGKDVYKKGKG